jgi:hypothetical protein
MHLGMGLILFVMILTVFLDVKEISKRQIKKAVQV